MACPACGLKALLHHERCAFCGHLLLEGARVPERQAEWDGLPEKLRAEFSLEFERGLAARRDWRERLQRNRVRHAVAGASFFALMMGLVQIPVLRIGGVGYFLWVLAEAAVGAALGHYLNRTGGGGYHGLLAFGGGYLAWTVLSLLAGVITGPLEGGMGAGFVWGLFILPGVLVAGTLGYLFGLNLTLRKSLED